MYRLPHDAEGVSPRPPRTEREEVFAKQDDAQFLHEHPDRVFCVRCISAQLFDGEDIDVAMHHIEAGEPVGDDLTPELKIRCRHGHCAQCGKPRLVAGVIVN